MANLSLVVVPAKALKDGQHKVRIAVSHNGETRYILTDVKIESQKQFRNGQVVGRPDANILNTMLRKELAQYNKALAELEYVEGLTCPELVALLKEGRRDKNITLKQAFEHYKMLSNVKQSSLETYDVNFRMLSHFFRTDKPIRSITHYDIIALDKALFKYGMSRGTVANIMGTLFLAINFAKNCGYVDASFNPKRDYKAPSPTVRDSWLTVEQVRTIRDKKMRARQSRKRDLFMLSYYLGGINAIDLVKIDFNKNERTLKYIRSKSTAHNPIPVEFEIPDEAREIIRRLKDKNGHISLAVNPMKKYEDARKLLNSGMRVMRNTVNISNLTFYSARKSFSQHAFELGISTQVIDYLLGHSMRRNGIIYHYVTVKPDMATAALRRVINHLNADLHPQTAVLAPFGGKIAESVPEIYETGTDVERNTAKVADVG